MNKEELSQHKFLKFIRMKKRHSLLWLLIGSLLTLQAQTVLEPTEKMALLQVLVTVSATYFTCSGVGV